MEQLEYPTWYGTPVRPDEYHSDGTVTVYLPTGEELIVRMSDVMVKGGCYGYQS